MTVVFCLDDNPHYLMMLRVAIRSLLSLHGNAHIVVVYAGTDETLMEAVRAEGATLARYSPTLTPEIIPKNFHQCIGAFLKLELALVPELAHADKVLYADCDVMFIRPIDELMAHSPRYMCMAREATAPFWHTYESMSYMWRGKEYVVPMPFPIWTFSSGVVVFNLARLRAHGHIHNFLAFCSQNVHRIGNLDQSLLNYFFGKRITRVEGRWNRPPYHADALSHGHIVHFHGPKPWETERPLWKDLRMNDFYSARERWLSFLSSSERTVVGTWNP